MPSPISEVALKARYLLMDSDLPLAERQTVSRILQILLSYGARLSPAEVDQFKRQLRQISVTDHKPNAVMWFGPGFSYSDYEMAMSGYAGAFNMTMRVDRPLNEIFQSLRPKQENTIILFGHGRIAQGSNPLSRTWHSVMGQDNEVSLESILREVAKSKSSFTHIVLPACLTGQVVQDWARISREHPELTQNVSIYMLGARYQSTHPMNFRTGSYLNHSQASIMRAWYNHLMANGDGLANRVIINGKVVEPLKLAIKELNEQLKSATGEEAVRLSGMRDELISLKAIADATNQRELYKALLNHEAAYPGTVDNLRQWQPVIGNQVMDTNQRPFSFSRLPNSFTWGINRWAVEIPVPFVHLNRQTVELVGQVALKAYQQTFTPAKNVSNSRGGRPAYWLGVGPWDEHDVELSYLMHDPDISAEDKVAVMHEEARNKKVGAKHKKYTVFDSIKKTIRKFPLLFIMGPEIDSWPMRLLENYVGPFDLTMKKERSLAQSLEALRPGEENTLLMLAHGAVDSFEEYPYREWWVWLGEDEEPSLGDILERIYDSGSAFTHLILASCNSGQVVEDFMHLQQEYPEWTEKVNVYIPAGHYQLHYAMALNWGINDNEPEETTSPLEAALLSLVRGIYSGMNIGSKAIIGGKVYDPLKTAIHQLKDKLQDQSLEEEERVHTEHLLGELQAIRKITEASNRRDLYKAMLDYKASHPEAITNFGTRFSIGPYKYFQPFSFKSTLPSDYTLTTLEPFLGSEDYPKILIEQEAADFVAQVALEMYSQLIDRQPTQLTF